MKDNKVESVIVKEGELSIWNEEEGCFNTKTPSNYYIINALGDYHFYLTRDRLAAQKQCEADYGVNKYIIRSVNDKKGKTKTEFGLTCIGSTSRRGTGSWLRKTV